MLRKLKELLHRDPEQFRIPRSVQEVIPIRTVYKVQRCHPEAQPP